MYFIKLDDVNYTKGTIITNIDANSVITAIKKILQTSPHTTRFVIDQAPGFGFKTDGVNSYVYIPADMGTPVDDTMIKLIVHPLS